MFADGPRMHEFLAEMHREVFAGRPGQLLTVGETPGVRTEQAVLYTDPRRAELDMVFQFEHVSLDQSPTDKFAYAAPAPAAVKASLYRWQEALGETGWNSLYWDNHDQPRAVSRFGDDDPQWWQASAKTLATVLHGLRGTPYVYQGEEIGMTNYPFASGADLRDVEVVNYLAGLPSKGVDVESALHGIGRITRDNARTPMQWDDGRYAGFSAVSPWLPANPNTAWLNAAAQVGVAGSVFEHYRALIGLRRSVPALALGSFAAIEEYAADAAVWAYTRSLGGARLLVLANAGRDPRTLRVGQDWVGAGLLLGSGVEADRSLASETVELAGWESRIYLFE
jgi:oligo-1,6-glucosidase